VGETPILVLVVVASSNPSKPVQVLGVELINEPYAGDFYHYPLSMIPYPNPLNADKRFLVCFSLWPR
jgi:hypothetical protein